MADDLDRLYEITVRIEAKLDKMSDRVSAIEIWKAEIMGKVAMVTIFVSLGLSLLLDSIKRKLNL